MKWIKTTFGDMLDYDLPEGCNAIILGVLKHQIVPVEVLLPHQVYRENIEKLMAKHETDEFVIIPYRSPDVLSFKNERQSQE